jgi:O-glycosyl hydrolase
MAAAPARTTPIAHAGATGTLEAVSCSGELLALHTEIRLPSPKWAKLATQAQWSTEGVQFTQRPNGQREWTGRIRVEGGKMCRYQETITESAGSINLAATVTAEADLALEGAFLFISVPTEDFAGGTCELAGGAPAAKRTTLPRTAPEEPHVADGTCQRVRLTGGSGGPAGSALLVTLDQARNVAVQDNRKWQDPSYSVYMPIHAGSLRQGESASIRVTLKRTVTVDRSPARLTLDAERARYRLDGFGGNFVYGIGSPVTQYNLDNLRVAWGRVGMYLAEWEPQDENVSAQAGKWPALEAHDKPGTNLHHAFLLMQQLQKKGIRYCVTVWDLPDWLYSNPPAQKSGEERSGLVIADDKWGQFLDCIGSFLLYGKKQYGVEPDLFSFNEPDYGVRVKLTAEQQRDAMKRIGAHLEKLGLKTRMLLADVAQPRGTNTYAEPTTRDSEAMRYVGAVAYHSWGGATQQEYEAWADLAERIKRPLLVTEVGVDAGAYRNPWKIGSWFYALEELRLYQELLLYARMQGMMQWEYTNDYGLADVQPAQGAGTSQRIVPSWRFWFIKQFSNLTPARASALTTASDKAKVLFTAFSDADHGVYTLHIANLGTGRPVTISGIPKNVTGLNAVCTSETEQYKRLGTVQIKQDGTVQLDLPAQSLLTLTTMEP